MRGGGGVSINQIMRGKIAPLPRTLHFGDANECRTKQQKERAIRLELGSVFYQPISLPEGELDRFRKQTKPKLDELLLTPEKIAEEESDGMGNDYHSRYPPRLKDGAGGDRPKVCVQAACGVIGPRARKSGDTGVCVEDLEISERRSRPLNARVAKINCY